MIDRITLARPYAKAIFLIAKKNKNWEEWSRCLKVLSLLVKQPEIKRILHDYTIRSAIRIAFFEKIAESIGPNFLNREAKNLIQLLADKRKLPLVPFIANIYEKYREEIENRQPVQLFTASPINEKQREDFISKLQQRFGKTIELNTVIDPSLMAGYVAKVGDVVIDGSLKSALSEMKQSMSG